MMKKVYFNHDGGVDDLISLFLLIQMDNVKLTGVSVIPATTYLTIKKSIELNFNTLFMQFNYI